MQDQAVGFRSEVGYKVMELIRKSDALHAVLHNQGDAAVAAVQNINAVIDTDAIDAKDRTIQGLLTQIERKDKELQAAQEKKPMRIWCTNNQVMSKYNAMKCKMEKLKADLIYRICEHCDTPIEEKLKEGCCEGCPIIGEVKAVFDND